MTSLHGCWRLAALCLLLCGAWALVRADAAPAAKRMAVAIPAVAPDGKFLAACNLRYATVPDVLAAITGGKYDIVVADATPETLHRLLANQPVLKAFTDGGGYLMLWGLDERGLADFNSLLGVEQMIRPYEMERAILPALPDPLMSGLTANDVQMTTGDLAADDVYSHVVDVDDVAPFATLPDGGYWGYADAHPGWDHWPRNMVNGFTAADTWKYCFTMNTKTSKTATKWTMTFPRALEFTDVQVQFTGMFNQINAVNLYFDDDPAPLKFTVKPPWSMKQTFALPAPRKAKTLTFEIADLARGADGNALFGVDNIWIDITRSPAFSAEVKPLLTRGVLVKYGLGQGGVILNEMRAAEDDGTSLNGLKKHTILATLLRNLGAAQSFAVPAPAPGARAQLSLAGLWQVTPADEGVITDRVGPITALPNPAACNWMGMRVPGNKSDLRPELAQCHRFFYRAQLDVPANVAGDSVFLHFPCNNLITTVFVNGVYCGFTRVPLAPWDCDITKAVKPGQMNELLVGIKDSYYAWPKNTAQGFWMPLNMKGQQWSTENMDFPVAYHLESGMLLSPELVVTGQAYTADIFAMPSVKNHTLALQITLNNPSAAELAVTVHNAIVPHGGGAAEKTFAPVQATIPAGQTLVITPSEAWATAKLWWPDDPKQYDAITTVSVDGQPVDTVTTKFGFREWTWDGPNFKLNGIPWHGHADTSDGTPAEMKARGQNMIRLWGDIQQVPDARLDVMDASGIPVRRTGIFDGEGGAYGNFLAGSDLFVHWIEQEDALIKSERNHPSIFIWSIENEMTFINARNWGHLDVWEPWCTKGAKEFMALDPTRPVMVDGGRALRDKSLPVYGGHYEETGLARDYPDEAYTLHDMFTNHDAWSHPWPIDKTKPILIGESFYVLGYPPAWFAALGGEQAFLGRTDARGGVGVMLKMLSEGYRWNDINFHFWVGGGNVDPSYYHAWSDIAVLCRQWNWTFTGGTTVARDLRVFNDTRYTGPITATWQLLLDGKVAAHASKDFTIDAGTAQDWPVQVPLPPVKYRTPAQWILTCTRDGKEVFRDVKTVALINPAADAKPTLTAAQLYVLDSFGSAGARLQARGIAFTAVKTLAEIPDTAKVVIIGKDSLTPRAATDPQWQALAANGVRVIVLEQANPLHNLALPADLEPTTAIAGRMAFIENPEHPIFAGLAQQDFFTWSRDHLVYRNPYHKATHGATSLVQCDDELNYTALDACPLNDGLILTCQLLVGEKLASDPVAQRLFDNLLNYAVGYHAVRKRTAVAIPADAPEAKLLAASNLQYDTVNDVLAAMTGGQYQIVIALATPELLQRLVANRAALKAFTGAGGEMMLWGLTAKGLQDFNSLLGVEQMIRPFEMEKVTLPATRDPLLAGLTMRDVVMESGQTIYAWSGDRFAANDVFSDVVDVDDVAPFCTLPDGGYWGYGDAAPGGDHYPRNMFNGFTSDDSWRYAFTISTATIKSAAKWKMTFPRAQQLTEVRMLFTKIFSPIARVKLYFDDDPTPVVFTLKQPWTDEQFFSLPAPRKVTELTVEVADLPAGALFGVDNMWAYVARPAAFTTEVKPLLNIGGLVKYQLGRGAVILNQLRILPHESNPVNGQKKSNIVSTLLRNMGATFAGRTLIGGAGLSYAPIALDSKCTAFLTADKGWFDTRDLALFPRGDNTFAGVKYAIRDFKTSPLPCSVMLAGPGTPPNLPSAVSGIPLNQRADALFFLHTAKYLKGWAPPKDGDQTPPVMFKYVVHYADGTTVDVPIRYDLQVGNWIAQNPQGLKEAALAWAAPFNDKSNDQGAVYQYQWINPHPDLIIATIDLAYDQGNPSYAVPVLLALTAATAVK